MNINFSCIYLRVKLCAMDVRVQSSGEGEGGRERRGQKAGEGRKWRKQRRGKQGREERRGGEENVPSAFCSPNCCNDQIWAKLKSVVWNSITVPHMCDSSSNTSVTFAASRGTWAVDLMERTHVGSNRHECSFDPLFHKACVSVYLVSIYLSNHPSTYLTLHRVATAFHRAVHLGTRTGCCFSYCLPLPQVTLVQFIENPPGKSVFMKNVLQHIISKCIKIIWK